MAMVVMVVVILVTMPVLGLFAPRCRQRGVVVLMPVVPQLGFVEQKEKHQAAQQHGKQLVRARLALERLGQQVHERGGHQGAGRQAEHVLRVAPQHGKAQGRSEPHAADAGGNGSDQDGDQGHVKQKSL